MALPKHQPEPTAESTDQSRQRITPGPPRRLIEYTRWLDATRLAGEIDLGADVNVQDEHGMTALHHAAALGARPCIRLLVACGRCDYLLRDNRGRYAFELAVEESRDYAVARLLMKKQVQQAHQRGVPAYEQERLAPGM